MLAIGIGFHNLPLGMVIATTFYQGGEKNSKNWLLIGGVALSTLLGGFLSFLFSNQVIPDWLVGSLLSLTLGMLIFILFSSGLDTNIKEMKKAGGIATLVACFGVLVPMILGFIIAMCFMPNGFSDFNNIDAIFNALFVGAILTATSVGITVETLRELNKLNTKVGTVILGAAIIDDVIGILVLSIVTSLHGGDVPIWVTFIKVVSYISKTTTPEHMQRFYSTFEDIKEDSRREMLYTKCLSSFVQKLGTRVLPMLDQIKDLIYVLEGNGRTTKRESINDFPVNAETPIKIEFCFARGGSSVLYAYAQENRYYIEQPYNGIYQISGDEYNSVAKYVL